MIQQNIETIKDQMDEKTREISVLWAGISKGKSFYPGTIDIQMLQDSLDEAKEILENYTNLLRN